MTRAQAAFVGAILTVACIALAVWAYPQAPPVIPTHWDFSGHPNGYMSRFWGLALHPLLVFGTCALLWLIPAISPKGFRLDSSVRAFNAVIVAVMLFEAVIATVAIRAAVGGEMLSMGSVSVGIGLLFVVIGNVMSKFRKNFFVGIRTPWTLASDEVWLRTHRFGGWTFVIGGIALAAGGFMTAGPTIMIAIITLIVVLPIVYSYVAYRQIEGFGPNGGA